MYLIQCRIVVAPPIKAAIGVVGNGEAADGLWVENNDVVKLSDLVVAGLHDVVITDDATVCAGARMRKTWQ